MTESLPYLLLVLALAAGGAALWFAVRAAGAEPIRAERDRAVGELAALRQENTRLATELAAAKAATEGRAESEEARFLALAAKALEASQANFMALANQTFEKHSLAAAGGVKEVLAPAQEHLNKLAQSVEALDKARLADKSVMGEQVRQIMDAVGSTNKTTQNLLTALRASPKMRGRWGEQTLRNVLELSGLSAHVDFTEQASTTDGEGARLRPDVLINLPGGRCIVVDSKVALSGYLDAMEATDDAAREAHLKKHAAELKAHVKGLSSKDYWRHVPDTADFVVLFVPGENFLAAAAERDPNLFDDAFAQKVIITTPSTMVALAKSVAYGWRQEQSAKNAQEIADLGRELYRRMGVMVKHIDDLGRAIIGANERYNSVVGSLERMVLPQTRKFRELGAGDDEDVPSPRGVEVAPRLPAPPEQLELTPPPQAKRTR
ncbi:MAG: DNA recombination protein RmuC [Terricaulis sp.]|nr:DNA recombination protein RmuC [Terricaulis sp.]